MKRFSPKTGFMTCDISAVVFIAFLTTVAVLNSGCGPAINAGDALYQEILDGKGCEPATSVCDGNRLMLCNADHRWEKNVNCADFEMPRECCTISGVAGCFKQTECKGR